MAQETTGDETEFQISSQLISISFSLLELKYSEYTADHPKWNSVYATTS